MQPIELKVQEQCVNIVNGANILATAALAGNWRLAGIVARSLKIECELAEQYMLDAGVIPTEVPDET